MSNELEELSNRIDTLLEHFFFPSFTIIMKLNSWNFIHLDGHIAKADRRLNFVTRGVLPTTAYTRRLRLHAYKRVGISLVEVHERGGKGRKTAKRGISWPGNGLKDILV